METGDRRAASGRSFFHLLNYDYNKETDRVEEIDTLEAEICDCPAA